MVGMTQNKGWSTPNKYGLLILIIFLLAGCASHGRVGPFEFGKKSFSVSVDSTMAHDSVVGQSVEVFLNYPEGENETFSGEVLEDYFVQQLVSSGYTRPDPGLAAQLYLLLDRQKIQKLREFEETERTFSVCGEEILDYVEEGYTPEESLPADFRYKASLYGNQNYSSNREYLGGERALDRQTVQQEELDKVCSAMTRKVSRQRNVVETRLTLEAIPSAGYFSGAVQPAVWRTEVEGSGGMLPLLVAVSRAIKKGEGGRWKEVVKSSDDDYLVVEALNKTEP